MTSKIIVNNIEADTGISTITFNNDISSNTVRGNIISDGTSTFDVISGVSTIGVTTAHVTSINNLSYPTAGSLSNRSLIINGAMQVAQRGTVVNAGNEYGGPDRYKFGKNDGAYTISQESDVPSGSGFAKSYKIDVTSAASSTGTQYVFLRQMIEGQDLQHLKKGTSSAESLTLQFWVKSTKIGTYVVQLYDIDTSSNRQICKTYTVNSSNTWEYKTITFAGDTTGAFDSDNAASLEINWWLYAGSTYTSGTLQTSWGAYSNANTAVGQVNAADSTSNNIFFTGIQLEVGKNATDFEHRSYGEELARCQRYYYEYPKGNTYNIIANGLANTSTNALFHFQYPVPMRSAPVIAASGNWQVIDGQSHSVSGFSAITDATELTGRVDATSSGLTAGRACMLRNNNDATATFSFNAEL